MKKIGYSIGKVVFSGDEDDGWFLEAMVNPNLYRLYAPEIRNLLENSTKLSPLEKKVMTKALLEYNDIEKKKDRNKQIAKDLKISVQDSIGNVIFLAGEQRYAVANSSFLFHGVYYNITQPMRFDEKNIREQLKSIERDQKLINDIIVERTKLSKDDVNKMFYDAETKTPEQAKSLGIISDIKLVDIPQDAQIMQVIHQQRPWQ